MTELAVVVPSRGRPWAVPVLAGAFRATCTADTRLIFAVDTTDPTLDAYTDAVYAQLGEPGIGAGCTPPTLVVHDTTTMVAALNAAATGLLAGPNPPGAVGMLGDDHLPHTRGWDGAWLSALALQPGIVYGNDTVMGADIPTQYAMSTTVVQALGHMMPGTLRHLYGDNYIHRLGNAARCITYLPHVVIEHVTPLVGRRPADEGYLRVNAPEIYEHDQAAFEAYWAEYGARDVQAVVAALATAGTP